MWVLRLRKGSRGLSSLGSVHQETRGCQADGVLGTRGLVVEQSQCTRLLVPLLCLLFTCWKDTALLLDSGDQLNVTTCAHTFTCVPMRGTQCGMFQKTDAPGWQGNPAQAAVLVEPTPPHPQPTNSTSQGLYTGRVQSLPSSRGATWAGQSRSH